MRIAAANLSSRSADDAAATAVSGAETAAPSHRSARSCLSGPVGPPANMSVSSAGDAALEPARHSEATRARTAVARSSTAAAFAPATSCTHGGTLVREATGTSFPVDQSTYLGELAAHKGARAMVASGERRLVQRVGRHGQRSRRRRGREHRTRSPRCPAVDGGRGGWPPRSRRRAGRPPVPWGRWRCRRALALERRGWGAGRGVTRHCGRAASL